MRSRTDAAPSEPTTKRVLITAGPTYEPIDAVRFIGNRSSGRLGVAIAEDWSRAGWAVTLLLGPNAATPVAPGIEAVRFGSAADLQALLDEHLGRCAVLIMAAAVGDYRPVAGEADLSGKRRRAGPLTLELEPTPDLLAGCAARSRPDHLLVGFALEPREGLLDSAERKLMRKGIDLIVANPLETMDAGEIEATLLGRTDRGAAVLDSTGGPVRKEEFASWLRERVEGLLAERRAAGAGGPRQTTGEAGDG